MLACGGHFKVNCGDKVLKFSIEFHVNWLLASLNLRHFAVRNCTCLHSRAIHSHKTQKLNKNFDLKKKEDKKPRGGSWSRSSWPVLGRRCLFGVNQRPLAASGGRYPFRCPTCRVSGYFVSIFVEDLAAFLAAGYRGDFLSGYRGDCWA
jgi:hypothetical protein